MLVSASALRDGDRAVMNAFTLPASVAVVGATADAAKWGHWLAKGAVAGTHRRRVYLVNRTGAEIFGTPSYRSLRDLPEAPELVAIAVPGHLVLQVIREALELGSRAFLVVAAQVAGEREAAELLAAHGARMIGPNSLGIYSAEGDLQLMWGGMRPGSLAIVSQSGQLGSEIAALGQRAGVGVSRFVSLGNQTDVTAAEVVESLIADDRTRTIGLYLEDFSAATELFAALRRAAEAGKHAVLLTTGESGASQALAQSHTGAMTSSMDLVDAACRASGVLRVRTPAGLVNVASYLDRTPPPVGNRVAIITDSGGQGGIAADDAARLGLELPELSGELRARLQPLLSSAASTRNPIDLAGSGEAELSVYAELPRVLAESGEVDAVVLSGYFGSYGDDTPQLLDAELAVAERVAEVAGVPVLVHAMSPDSRVAAQLRGGGVPVYGRIEDTLFAVSAAHRLGASAPERGVSSGAVAPGTQTAVREALGAVGIPFPELVVVRSADEAAAAAERLGGTVVLKAAWLAHKTEAGGVALHLRGPEETRAAFAEMHERIGDGDYTVEAQDTREHVAEFIVAARRDPVFGPVITVGYGGTETEVWSDIALELAPVDADTARGMVASLRSSRLLEPWRGRPALAAEHLAQLIARLGGVLAASPGIREIELNPVRVGTETALAVDCLVILDPEPRAIPTP
ncbi:MAG: acetate--CoA ligase family protein [Leucobacter sp.]